MKGNDFMKFIKGVVIGTMISAGMVMLYTDTMNTNKKKIMKKGRRVAKKMGII